MRTSTISAASIGRPAASTSPMPLSSICQVRASTRIDSLVAKARPRVRSASVSDTSSATAGTIFTRVTKWVNSARSPSTIAGSAPESYWSRSSLSARGDVGAHQRFEQIDDARCDRRGRASAAHVFGAHRPGGVRDRLIEQRQRIAHRAFGGARDQGQRFRLGLDRFLGGDALQMFDQQRGIDPAQIEALAARQHRDRHFADFGGGENEFGVRRRLFQRLQQRVEGGAREHVHFVEDIDFVARRDRRIADGVVDLAHVVDAVMGGGIHLDDVEMAAFHDRFAVDAEHRHFDGRRGDRAVRQFVIERARQNARRRGLADAAHAGENPGLRNAAGLERVRDRTHHGVLADQIVERGRPVFARQHAIRSGFGRGVVFRHACRCRPSA